MLAGDVEAGRRCGGGRAAAGRPDGRLKSHYPYEKLVVSWWTYIHMQGVRKLAGAVWQDLGGGRTASFNRESRGGQSPAVEPALRASRQVVCDSGESLSRIPAPRTRRCTKEFADVWLYPAYWDKFAETGDQEDAQGVHAYSHCYTFTERGNSYDVSGDAKYLSILKNFYDWMQKRQTYATGGYGPDERFVYSDGALGDSLEVYSASFECPCCSWAGFRNLKYLMMYTGEARYGDWIERLRWTTALARRFQSGIAARICVRWTIISFPTLAYYSRNAFTCCSNLLPEHRRVFQPDILFTRNGSALHVNLYVPSD